MKISASIFALLFLLLAWGKLTARQHDWNYIGTEDNVSWDRISRKDYTLIFINKSPTFDSAVKLRMLGAFLTVYPKAAGLYNEKTLQKVFFVTAPKYTRVAATAGGIVRYNRAWFVRQPGEIDVMHEVMPSLSQILFFKQLI